MLNRVFIKDEQGYVLVVVFLLLTLLGILLPFIFNLAISNLYSAKNYQRSIEESYLRAGIVNAVTYDITLDLKRIIDRKGYISQEDLQQLAKQGSYDFNLSVNRKLKLKYLVKEVIDESSKVNVNLSSQSTLENIQSIGEKLAAKIINNRSFFVLQEVVNIEGIGEVDGGIYQAIKDCLTVRSDGRINVNTATVEILTSLAEIDLQVARDIIVQRPFSKVEELVAIKGISLKDYEKIKDLLKVTSNSFSLKLEIELDDDKQQEEVIMISL